MKMIIQNIDESDIFYLKRINFCVSLKKNQVNKNFTKFKTHFLEEEVASFITDSF